MEKERIEHALNALDKEIDKSGLKVQQKIALKSGIEKLKKYYDKKNNEIAKTNNFYVARNKDMKLLSKMVTHIVAIDDAIKGYADPNKVESDINRTVTSVEKKPFFKIKRLTR